MDDYSLPRDKAALIYIYKILNEHSDANHPLTQQNIVDKLGDDYGVGMERKAVKRNLTVLESAGVKIEYLHRGCYLAERIFTDAELRILIDGVLCSRYFTATQSKKLIKKLEGLASKHFKSLIKHVCFAEDWENTDNQSLFDNVETIETAIGKKRQIEYDYNKYGIDRKLHKTSHHCVSPFQLILKNQKYYLMAYSDYFNSMVYHRLDHITNMCITDAGAKSIRNIRGYENGIDYKKFITQMPYMYSDDPRFIDFVADARIVDDIVEWFGSGAKMYNLKDDETKVRVSVKASPMAMKNWALQYLEYVEIIGPADLRDSVANTVAEAGKKYNKDK